MKTLRVKLIAIAFLFGTIGLITQPAVADSFELFTATGTFQNQPNDQPAALSGSFVVNLTTGLVVSVDLFHGTTELNAIQGQGTDNITISNLYFLGATNLDGDLLGLVLVAPNNLGSLSNYTGGTICSVLSEFNGGPGPECRSPLGAVASAFTLRLTAPQPDVLLEGTVADAGPVAVPEPGTLVLAAIAAGACLLRRRLT